MHPVGGGADLADDIGSRTGLRYHEPSNERVCCRPSLAHAALVKTPVATQSHDVIRCDPARQATRKLSAARRGGGAAHEEAPLSSEPRGLNPANDFNELIAKRPTLREPLRWSAVTAFGPLLRPCTPPECHPA
jgi:hypothetical protein